LSWFHLVVGLPLIVSRELSLVGDLRRRLVPVIQNSQLHSNILTKQTFPRRRKPDRLMASMARLFQYGRADARPIAALVERDVVATITPGELQGPLTAPGRMCFSICARRFSDGSAITS
jgi:hypothetical protein